MSTRRLGLFKKGGEITPATLGAKVWFDGSDVSKFTLSGSDIDKWESSILSSDYVEYAALTKCILDDNAMSSPIGLTCDNLYIGQTMDFNSDFTLLSRSKGNDVAGGSSNLFITLDSVNTSYTYIVTSNKLNGKLLISGIAEVVGTLGSSLNNYVNTMIMNNQVDYELFEDTVLIDSSPWASNTGKMISGQGFMKQTQTVNALFQAHLQQFIFFDRALNATEKTQMNDFLDGK